MSKDTALGKKAKEYINSGKLVPDALVIDMLSDRIKNPDSKKGYLLDGFPRTIPQAEEFDKILGNNAKVTVITLDVPDDIIVKRIEGRLMCKKCGNIHNRYFSPPSKENICDKCGGELYQRPDDKLEVVKERLRVYHEQTKPLIQYYEKKGLLSHVNGENDTDTVFNDIMSKLKK